MRVIRLFFILILLMALLPSVVRAEEPIITADAAILIEATTGRVLWEKEGEARHYPASMTKMMTTILLLENIDPAEEIFISPQAAMTENTSLGIKAGERLTAKELTTGMMMVSDNGAAVAIAEAMDGDTATFAKRMNAKAKEIGMENTNFVNPNGLTDPNHYSTPHDIARLARYAMENDDFRQIVQREKETIYWSYPNGRFKNVINTNELLGNYEGITGVKTGWTNAAGGCLTASAKRNGLKLIAVVMHSKTEEDRFSDMRKILNYGFQHVHMVHGFSKEELSRRIFIVDGRMGTTVARPIEDVEYPLMDGEDPSHCSIAYDAPRIVTAPVSGKDVGKVIIKYDDKSVGSVALHSERVEEGFSIGSFLVSVFGWML